MLQHVSDRVCSGINQDGKGTEPVSESDKDFRGLRKGAMNWNVRVCPKQTIREEAAKTGDSQQAGAWAMLCLGAGILILLLAVKKD